MTAFACACVFSPALIEVLFTPITYKVVGFVKKKENIDTFDNEVKYKIFG